MDLPLLDNLNSIEQYRLLNKPPLTNIRSINRRHRTIPNTISRRMNSFIDTITTIRAYIDYIFTQVINEIFISNFLERNNFAPVIRNYILEKSIAANNLNFCEILCANNYCILDNINYCNAAVRSNNYEVLEWLRQQNPPAPFNEITCSIAAQISAHLGNHNMLIWLHTHGCPWDSRTCSSAVFPADNINCLIYAHENGCPWDVQTCNSAAANNHINCLTYAHETIIPPICEWDVSTCNAAAESNSLECLMYAHNNGCPWNAETCLIAAENGSRDCLQYAINNGCEHNLDELLETVQDLQEEIDDDNEDNHNLLDALHETFVYLEELIINNNNMNVDNIQDGGTNIVNNISNILLFGIILVLSILRKY